MATLTGTLPRLEGWNPAKLFLQPAYEAVLVQLGDSVTVVSPAEFSAVTSADLSSYEWLLAWMTEADDSPLWDGFAVLHEGEWILQEWLPSTGGGGTVELNSDMTEAY